ncbi:N-acetylmuramoyl-L-alanine amidase [Salinicoccus roseus]|uniref:N-acetylmuramoyl-L-alanine amidase n=1 Tax=Salinicoccus roseus TaxID=45670 RepID=UPI003566ACD6
MVKITEKLLTSRYSRPRTKMHSVRGVVMHYTANPNANPDSHYRFFEYNNRRYAGAHYFVKRGYIVRMIPEGETTYHANETGYSKVAAFNGYYSSDGYKGNANSCTIGIEMELEPDGSIHPETIRTCILLAADIMRRYNLPMSRLVRHYDITGKICPLQFVRDPRAYQEFRNGVSRLLSGASNPPAVAEEATDKVSQSKRPVNNLSIVDFMEAHGMDSSFSNRKKLAQQFGINGYSGTANQNIELLKKLNASDGDSKPSKPAKGKSVKQMADEVEAGKHGSGHANRRKSLGVDSDTYAKVRAEVNRRAGVSAPKPKSKSIAQMADEVVAGKHGSGHNNRRRSLGVSQSVYNQVRAEVNRRAGIKSAPKRKSITQMAKEVVAGKHGQGHANRQRSLGVDNATYQKVRARVNQMYK